MVKYKYVVNERSQCGIRAHFTEEMEQMEAEEWREKKLSVFPFVKVKMLKVVK